MSEPANSLSLDREDAKEFPIRPLRSPYFILRTTVGGYYLEEKYNEKLVKSPVNRLSLFLADALLVAAPGSDLGEVRYKPRKDIRPLRYINEGALQDFIQAASDFYKGGNNAGHADLRLNFRLPDPAKEPDAYWVFGERFAPQLLILWGCEKEQGSSLALIGEGRSVVKELRSKAISWTRLFREGIEFIRYKDSQEALKEYLAFPVLSADGRLTHVERFKDGQYVKEEVQPGGFKSFKVRPLKKLPARAITRFKRLSEEFYRKAHLGGCACSLCAAQAKGPSAGGGQGASGRLTYEQELRRGFRLPDPELRPDAYFVAGPALNEQLLILCPHPGVKDAEEISQMEKDLKWAEDKVRTAEDKERARELRQQYDSELILHNLYKRYFYTDQECLPLTTDETLGKMPSSVASSAEPAALSLPGAAPAAGAKPSLQTVVAKLKSIDWRKIIITYGTLLLLLIVGGVTAYVLWPKHLAVLTAAMSNDPALDPDNHRNVIQIEFNNRVEANHAVGTNAADVSAPPYGQYALYLNGDEMKLLAPQLNSTNHRQLTLTLDMPEPLVEGGAYVLSVKKVRDVWGNFLVETNVPVTVADHRSPSYIGPVLPASPVANDSISIGFDEPLDAETAGKTENYSIVGPVAGMSFIAAAVKPDDRKMVVLKADKPFVALASYSLKLSSNLTDASAAKNRLNATNISFSYVDIPLRLESVSAKDSQNIVKLTFNKPFNRKPAQSALKVVGLNVGPVIPLDDLTLELVLTNSYMTNATYALQITGLKDASGKSTTGLTTNATFTYEGTVDTTAPSLPIKGVSFNDTRRNLTLQFDKNLRGATATKKENYVVLEQTGETWSQVGSGFDVKMAPNSTTGVILTFENPPPKGRFRIQYSGIEDLFGNAAGGQQDFNTGLGYKLKLSGPFLMNADGTEISFRVSPLLDSGCESSDFFKLCDGNKNPFPDIEVSSVQFQEGANSTQVRLKLSGRITTSNFYVQYINLKEQDTVTPLNGFFSPNGAE